MTSALDPAGGLLNSVTSSKVRPPSNERSQSLSVYSMNCSRGLVGWIAAPPPSPKVASVHASGLTGRIPPVSWVPTSKTASEVGCCATYCASMLPIPLLQAWNRPTSALGADRNTPPSQATHTSGPPPPPGIQDRS